MTPSGGPVLTTIVSIDPIYVYFDVDERVAAARARGRDAPRPAGPPRPRTCASLNIPVQFGLANETGYPAPRRDSTSSTTASTRRPARSTCAPSFANAGPHASRPASSCACASRSASRIPALLVTERAIGTDQDRKYVLVVNDQNVVEYRPVKLGAVGDGLRVDRRGPASPASG